MKRFLVLMIFAMVFMATSAQAASGKMYVSGNFGYGILTDVDDEGIELSFDPGWGLNGAVGYDMGQFRVEGEIGYRSYDLDEVTILGVPFPVDGDVTALTFMANGYYDHDMGSALTPYVGFGLGFVDAEFEVTGLGSTSDTEIAYQVMLGAAYDISPQIALTAGYRFFGFSDNDGAFVHELNLGARFMF